MIDYKGFLYPELHEALGFYSIPSMNGGFNKHEKECVNLLIKLPKSGVILSVDGLSKDHLFELVESNGGTIPSEEKEKAQSMIDSVCQGYFDAITSGDLTI